MSNKTKVIIAALSLLVSFAVGRYTANVTKTVSTDKQTTVTDDKNTETTTSTEIYKPDGTKTITTVTIDNSDTTENHTDQEKTTQTVAKASAQYNLSILGGIYAQSTINPLVYGASINKEILGPVTGGAWILSNGTFGVSVGVNF